MPSWTLIESMAMEKAIVYYDHIAEPIGTPTPVSPAAPVAEEVGQSATDSKSEAEWRVEKWRIVSINRRSPDVNRIIDWNVNYIRLSRHDLYDLVFALRFRGNDLLGC
jgi:hypothetical protein